MKCKNCELEFNEADLSQVFAHEHDKEIIIHEKNIGKKITHCVSSILFKNHKPFYGTDWECIKYIEDNYGNGFKAIMFKVEKI